MNTMLRRLSGSRWDLVEALGFVLVILGLWQAGQALGVGWTLAALAAGGLLIWRANLAAGDDDIPEDQEERQ